MILPEPIDSVKATVPAQRAIETGLCYTTSPPNPMMRVLFVGQDLPYPTLTGGRARTAQFVDALAGLEGTDSAFAFCASRSSSVRPTMERFRDRGLAEPTFFIMPDPQDSMAPLRHAVGFVMDENPRTLYYRWNGFNAWLRNLLRAVRPAVTVFDGFGPAACAVRLRQLGSTRRVVVSLHDAASNLWRDLRSRATGVRRFTCAVAHRTTLHEEMFMLRRADEMWVASEIDQQFYMNRTPRRAEVFVVPNCVPSSDARVERVSGAPPRALFIGSYHHPPNVEAAQILAGRIWPDVQRRRPDACLAIAGPNMPKTLANELRDCPGVEVLGVVPDARAALAASDVLAVPLLGGSGTRIKILDALAVGCPVVSTPKGAEGLELQHDVHIVLSDLDHFADAVVDLLADAAKRRRLADAGRIVHQQKYSIDRLRALLADRLQRLET